MLIEFRAKLKYFPSKILFWCF